MTLQQAKKRSRGTSLTFLLPRRFDGVSGQRHAPAALPQGKRMGIRFTGGWVGSRTGLDGYGISPPTGIRSPDGPARSQ